MAMNAGPQQNNLPAIVTIASGALLAIGSFLTWVKVEASVPSVQFSQSFNAGGTELDDGWITLVCGIVALVAGVMFLRAMAKGKLWPVLTLVAAAIALVVGFIDYSDASGQVSLPAAATAAGAKVDASAGIGLYIVIIAGVGALVGGIMMLRAGSGGAATPVVPPPADTPPTA